MRIWYALPVFPVRSETFVTTEIRALLDLGHDVSVLSWAPAPADAAVLLGERRLQAVAVDHGSPTEHLRALLSCARHPVATLACVRAAISFSRGRPLELLRAIPWIPRSVQLWARATAGYPTGGRPDVVHLFWGHYPSLLGHLLLELTPEISMTTSLGAYDLVADYGGSRAVGRRAGFVRTFARANVPVLVERGIPESRIVLEVHGVDLSRVPHPAPDRIPTRFVSVGRLIPDKGMDDVIRAFAQVVDAGVAEAELHLVGDGPDRERLERLAGDLKLGERVHFTGPLSQEDVFRELSEATVLLFLSRHGAERLPNVVKEAMACGCVCIATASPGIEELLVDGRTGRLVSGPGEAARAAVDLVTGDPQVISDLREAGRSHVREHFDIRAVARRLSDRWREVAPTRPGAGPGATTTAAGSRE